MSNKKKVALIFGGRSAEHEVSLRSAINIAEALDKNLFEPYYIGISQTGTWFYFPTISDLKSKTVLKDIELKNQFATVSFASDFQKPLFYIHKPIRNGNNNNEIQTIYVDVAFPIMHGTFGEDGCIQGLFQMLNLPFVGCGVLSSAIGMDKDLMKKVLVHAGIPNTPWKTLYSWESPKYEELVAELGSPFFIKPANAGSSVGVHKIKDKESFQSQLQDAFKYDHKVLAEKFISGREIECSVKGLMETPQASMPGEVIPQHEFYSYEAKYLDDKGAVIKIPADMNEVVMKRIQKMAEQVFTALCCSGLSRVDFFLTNKDELYVNEINTMPGFTSISMYPKMWEASGVSYTQLITDLIQFAVLQYQRENSLKRTFS